MPQARSLDVAIVVGEASGDQLGAKLMRALREATGGRVGFFGVGGPRMTIEGLSSLFPLEDVAVMGIAAVLPRIPKLLRRIRETTAEVIRRRPDVLVIIDSPDFTHRVARRVRAALPDVPIVDYVSPSVWAWRPGRAAAMRAYVDHVLALLPFEPEAHRRLGGPPCTYVGHPFVERLAELKPSPEELSQRHGGTPRLLVMPGSRRYLVDRMLPPFRDTIAAVLQRIGPAEVVIPAVDHLTGHVAEATRDWPVRPIIAVGEAEKFAAYRTARAALVCSGTSTLEVALAGVPMVVAYKTAVIERPLRYVVKLPHSIVLANLVLGENVIPEYVQEDVRAEVLAPKLSELIAGAARERQLAGLARIAETMSLGEETPSRRAARLVLETVAAARRDV